MNDPNTPPAVYNTDRSGTFTYAFKYLTHSPADPNAAKARYRVRLHLSDPKDNKVGQRQFNIAVNGRHSVCHRSQPDHRAADHHVHH